MLVSKTENHYTFYGRQTLFPLKFVKKKSRVFLVNLCVHSIAEVKPYNVTH